jgi:type IV pilus assembly protein PilX
VTAMPKFDMRRRRSNQSGVVLITGLIFVVILTLIVLAVLGVGTLEERMAANAMNRQVALQAAEAVSRYAVERLLPRESTGPYPIDGPFTWAGFTAACTDGFCNRGGNVNLASIDWSDSKTATFADASLYLAGVPSQPRFIIEAIGPAEPSGKKNASLCPIMLFRITARGVGPGFATVIVETMHKYQLKTPSPDLGCQ